MDDSTGIRGADLRIHRISELNDTEYPFDSAEGEEKYAGLAVNYRESYILDTKARYNIEAFYPRIKRLKDGSYIMIFHNSKLGGTVYCIRSEDCLEWSEPVVVFEGKKIQLDCGKNCFADAPTFHLQDTGTDMLKYMNPDACVLSDGRILCVTAFRAEKHYRFNQYYDGVAYKISDDGGRSWGDERIVYHGNSWEPSAMEADNGDIYIFWTCSAPSFYELTAEESQTYSSSGVALIRSSDNGETWKPAVSEAPFRPGYEYYVMRQHVCTETVAGRDVNIYTDQMPVAVTLHKGTVVLAAESRLFNLGNAYRFSVSYNHDGFAKPVALDETGPADRQTNLFDAAAPYLLQFDSGEVVLTYNRRGTMYYRMADCAARNFYEEHPLLTGISAWGSSEKISSHSAVMSIGTPDFSIRVVRVYLNHVIHAKKMTPSMAADISDWEENTDALFVGGESPAQVSVRAAYDDEKVYLLAERLDIRVTDADEMKFYLRNGDKGFYRITMDHEKIAEMSWFPDGEVLRREFVNWEKEDIGYAVYMAGTGDEGENMDHGILYKLAIPRKMLHADNGIKLQLALVNCDVQGGPVITDGPGEDAVFDQACPWFRVTFQ